MKQAANRNLNSIPKRSNGQPARFQAFTISQLFETYRDPRAVLMEIAGMETEALAAKYSITPLEALQERRYCAQAVLPYVAQKLPVQVDMRHTRAIHLNIVDDRQYAELVELSDTNDDTTLTIEAQLLDSSAVRERDVSPAVPRTPPSQDSDDDSH